MASSSSTSVRRNKRKRSGFILALAPYRMLTFFVKCLFSLGTAILMLRRLYTVDDENKKQQKKKNAIKQQTLNTISSIMKSNNQQLVIFYGSQTGTAEGYAHRIAKDYKRKYHLDAMVACLDQYDMKYLDTVPGIAVFVVASYGEGEPTDNAASFYSLLDRYTAKNDLPFSHLRYCIFGLGNSSYPVFNGASKTLDRRMNQLGAQRLGERGQGDDNSSMEEDFMQWSNHVLWPQLEKALSLTVDADHNKDDVASILTTYTVTEIEKLKADCVCLGEQSSPCDKASYSSSNPYLAPVQIRSLLDNNDSNERHCMHIDIDLSGSNLTYQAGDHIAMFPIHTEEMVQRTASMFGIADKLDTVIHIIPTAENTIGKSAFPTPTTYQTALRRHLDISKVPSRQDLKLINVFASSAASKTLLAELAGDLIRYKTTVVDARLTLVEVLDLVCKEGETFSSVPFALLIDIFARLQPRFYSISSSNTENASSASVTCVTLQYQPIKSSKRTVYGINTNYLWSVYEHSEHIESILPIRYAAPTENKLPIYIREANNFKMPRNISIPIIMVGPGTGVAPFRGFVRERAFLKQSNNAQVGTTILFFGCRNHQDYLYKDEWPSLFKTLGNSSKIITAFSRETASKMYVQHQIKIHGQEVWDLLSSHGAHLYVCGDANKMARDVYRCIIDVVIEHGSMTEADAIRFVADLKKQNRYQEDVWA
ncbi:ARF-binding protein [Mucor velutinosus]|uniref:NADPH--cytochrome P450 reductase n=1 Tax=Mucor velutinosus TaxID=708070 RepID=A0AAN7DBK0_9FUNG|nr:ARF-binding protein [Mucor velutinosus]